LLGLAGMSQNGTRFAIWDKKVTVAMGEVVACWKNGLVPIGVSRYMTIRKKGVLMAFAIACLGQNSKKRGISMKCPKCWSPHVKASRVRLLHRIIASCFFVVPVSCRHCFHCFHASRWTYRSEGRRGKKILDLDLQSNASDQILSFKPAHNKQRDAQSKQESPKMRRAA
jgi:hypothetical protein